MLDNNEENVENTVNKVEEAGKNASLKEKKVETQVDKVEETVENVTLVEDKKEEILETNKDPTLEAVDAIEKSVAAEAEKEVLKHKDLPVVDYTAMTLEELVLEFKKTLSKDLAHKIKPQIEAIKSTFNQKFGVLLAQKKEAFLADGGNSIDFQFSIPIKTTYNKLLSDYKKQRDAYYASLEKQLHENLEKRIQVIERLKNLIEEADATTMYKEFKKIQDTWRAIGPVSKTRYNDTWKTYHHHVERFYDLLHLSNDLRDLDFKNNLEEKLVLILKAEDLTEVTDINLAFKELQELHKIWKEDIGPVSREMREPVWQKFSDVTKIIHDKRHQHFREVRSNYQEIINKKLAVVKLLNEFDTSKNKTHNDWQKSIKEFEELRQQYFNEGKLPYSKSEQVWRKFKGATKKINNEKNLFYKQEKGGQQDNLKKKIALIEIAESLKESEDWEMATNAMKKIQADWKEIGHVPRKFSDDIWKRFKAACNHYFNRYHQQKNAISKDQQEIVDAKKTFLDSLKEEKEHTKESILGTINTWKELGVLPRNARHLEGKFYKKVDKLLESLSLDKQEISMLKFKNLIDGYIANNDVRKLDSEQLFLRKKIEEVGREIQQLENNLGFFSNAKQDNPLVLNVKKQVDTFKKDLVLWKEKWS
ncbi:MAG: DUF349 domain-containing protein, partial [Polaribacter sp.]